MRPRSGRPPGAEATATRERITEEARRIFSDVGYGNATPAMIAGVAGVTRAMIYRYFGSKLALYQAVFEGLGAQVSRRLLSSADHGASGLRRLGDVFRAGASLNRDDPTYARFTMSALVDTARIPELAALPTAQLDQVRGHLMTLVDDAVRQGELPGDLDRAAAGDMLIAALWGLGLFAAFVGNADETDRATELLVRVLDAGLSSLEGRPSARAITEAHENDR